MSIVPITSPELNAAEVSFFAALCSDDYQYLGVPDKTLKSSWSHCSEIVKRSEQNGFRNILCPSSYQVGQDTLSFVAGCAPITSKMNLLAAVRCGEMQPIMLARTIATLDHMLEGRLTINIISSDFPGQVEDSAYRYQRSREVVEILRQAWTQEISPIRARFISLKACPHSLHGRISRMAGRCCILGAILRLRWIYVPSIVMCI